MSVTVGRYTFSSWLRRGIGTRIVEPDRLGTGGSGTKQRATVPVDVVLNGAPQSKSFSLIGPGDVIGVNPQMVVRTEPVAWVADFEPNYLAFIEFYDEDFLWRYTPARAQGDKLSPWLALLVLEAGAGGSAGEFAATSRRQPLPSITVAESALPLLTDNWALGHVHINEGHADATSFERFLLSLRRPGAANADKIISRLFSARRLNPNTAYAAFLVPSFETGRLAGLGADPSNADSQAPAWTPGNGDVELPVYHQWSFRTGENEDFELLVERLQPRPVDRRVGIRSMDASVPGFGLAAGADIGPVEPPSSPQTTLGLEGALRAPTTESSPAALALDRPFFAELADLLNLPDDRRQSALGEIDPVVAPPIYGGPHALTERIDPQQSGWVSQLNRDPRMRVSAGYGTRVIQRHQEDYAARAWAQVKSIIEQNRLTNQVRVGLEVALTFHSSFFAKLGAGDLLSVARPVTKKVKGSPTTLHHLIGESRLASAPLDAAARRLIAPRRPLGRRLREVDSDFSQSRLVEEIDSGRATAAPPKPVPDGLPTEERLSDLAQAEIPAWLRLLARARWPLLLLLLLLLVALVLAGLWPAALLLALVAAALAPTIASAARKRAAARLLGDSSALGPAIRSAPARPGFTLVISAPPAGLAESAGGTEAIARRPTMPAHSMGVAASFSTPVGFGRDTVEAANFRAAAARLADRLAIRPAEPDRPPLDVAAAAGKLEAAMQPNRAWPILLASRVVLTFAPNWLLEPEHLVPAMAYPDFDDPMYAKLRDLSSEYFLPNLQLIPDETITLLKTNPAFIEAYMVGLNQEFGRELLWREYPTDRRGSYFRQFWSVRGIIQPDHSATDEQLKSNYRDVDPLDSWPKLSALGSHRPKDRPNTGDLVLTIRGKLLRKYPNTLIYAQRARMARRPDGTPNPTAKPVIREVASDAEMKSEILFPLFTAEVLPDIRFFGFDLTVDTARGAENPQAEDDDWGWYFIIQELPGEPRFGMDSQFQPDSDPATPISWNDLAWDKMPAGRFMSPASPPIAPFSPFPPGSPNHRWGRHSADMAAILFQRPVMVAVHAREMLGSVDA